MEMTGIILFDITITNNVLLIVDLIHKAYLYTC